MLRKLGSYPRQNGFAVALREAGAHQRTLFILDWLQSVELRRRDPCRLNKGEARATRWPAVFFYRLGEIRDRSFEQLSATGPAASILVICGHRVYGTRYIWERCHQCFCGAHGKGAGRHVVAISVAAGGEHINLTLAITYGAAVRWRSEARLVATAATGLACFIFRVF